ncbi:uncharacterized protein BX664DRAFT_339310 [Halteromyces radiatus]|uniref:uncharacterized protein n=1 Tax=Halteromyces radiatus TaxID=101107 RepID=UPI0022208BA4|nr:uncharacterized protein BX664DRAFT_339310 [Halteromyces radiatus]KAI8082876.1 hypothetical protein BX664DRAFT_339310 [Halteromyces radiatus]
MKLLTCAFTLLSTGYFLTINSVVQAQEGSTTQTSSAPSSYSCDPNICKLANNCLCASSKPPNGLDPKDTPQFVVVTFDDSIQDPLYATAQQMLNVTNPNGCKAKGTWYVSMQYTDFSLVQKWYAAGNEVADHTFTHVGNPSAQEISSAKSMLYEYGGVPLTEIRGFRAPFLNYTADTLKQLSQQQFSYDSSSSASSDSDRFWPYTLDNGMANDCWTGICDPGKVKLPGFWEFPMYAVMNNASISELMDVYLSGSPEDVTKWSLDQFEKNYNGGRQPFGIYVHPTHLSSYPGLPDPKPLLDGVVNLIKTVSEKKDVWVVSNQQLLQYMKNPVKSSELGNQPYMKCEQPVIPNEICNGLDDDNNGNMDDNLLNNCNFGTSNFKTCFNCPSGAPTVSSPTPSSSTQNGTAGYRYPVPDNCDSIWWDPIGNKCYCERGATNCQYKSLAVETNKTSTNNGSSDGSIVQLPLGQMALSIVFVALTTLF